MDSFAESLYFIEGFNISNKIPEKIYLFLVHLYKIFWQISKYFKIDIYIFILKDRRMCKMYIKLNK